VTCGWEPSHVQPDFRKDDLRSALRDPRDFHQPIHCGQRGRFSIPFDHLGCDLRLGLELQAFRDACGGTPAGVIGPVPGHIQPGFDDGVPGRAAWYS
jgi:hypothetical protein